MKDVIVFTFSYGTLNVSHDLAVLVVEELYPYLGHLRHVTI